MLQHKTPFRDEQLQNNDERLPVFMKKAPSDFYQRGLLYERFLNEMNSRKL